MTFNGMTYENPKLTGIGMYGPSGLLPSNGSSGRKEQFWEDSVPQPASSDKTENKSGALTTTAIIVMIIFVAWILLGIAAFIMSIVCFGRSGTTAQHVIGFLLAVFFGPFYWIYYFVVKSYCRNKTYLGGNRKKL